MRFIVFVARPVVMLLTKRDWRGTENLPERGFIVAVNHISYVDPFTFGHFMFDNGYFPRYLAKASLLELPLLGRLIRAAGQIPVHRGSSTAGGAFAEAVDAVNRGACIIFYPEGTLTRDPNLWPMTGKTGAARVSLASGCPVIPVAQWGPQEILAPYAKRLRLFPRKTMTVVAGPPVDLDELRDHEVTAKLLGEATDKIMNAITALLAGTRGETAPLTRISPKDARACAKPLTRRRAKKPKEN